MINYFYTSNKLVGLLQQYLSRFSTAEEQQQKLEELAAAHPYFTPAQFELLLKKTAAGETDESLAEKNAVLFNNPSWLSFQVQEFINKESIPEIVATSTPGFNSENTIDHETPEAPPVAVEDQVADTPGSSQETAPLLKDILSQPASAFPDELPAFQPLYSSDYFASQGIKLSEEIQSTDKLGKQLKSFTEWLKGMKKLHPQKMEEKMSQQPPDVQVQKQAEKSNTEDAVLTEAMAEVLLLQGKADKAAEIYHKLSLLNPGKSTYFAAKIENLKGS